MPECGSDRDAAVGLANPLMRVSLFLGTRVVGRVAAHVLAAGDDHVLVSVLFRGERRRVLGRIDPRLAVCLRVARELGERRDRFLARRELPRERLAVLRLDARDRRMLHRWRSDERCQANVEVAEDALAALFAFTIGVRGEREPRLSILALLALALHLAPSGLSSSSVSSSSGGGFSSSSPSPSLPSSIWSRIALSSGIQPIARPVASTSPQPIAFAVSSVTGKMRSEERRVG